MFEKLWNAQPTAALRRIHFTFRDSTTGDNVTPASVTGKKVDFRLNGGATLVTTTNDVVIVNAASHLGAGYIELTAAELAAFVSGELIGNVHGITGVKVEDLQATLYPFDPFDVGLSAAAIADALLTRNQKGGSDGPADQSVAAALAGGLMKLTIVAGVLTVKHADGSTAFSRTLSRSALDAIVASV